jgi:outer membrane murein-binding lipoprotein Lpp
MGKFLRVLVVFVFLLSIPALILGIMLFNKRELLKGRTQKLEKSLIGLGFYIEEKDAQPPADPPQYEAKDISPCTPEIPATLDRDEFWKTYPHEMEQVDFPKLDLNKNKIELAQYYKIDLATGDYDLDEFGRRKTDGTGTMQEVLTGVLGRAEKQYNVLIKTRDLLKKVREELIKTITDLNSTKGTLRLRLKDIEDLKATIARLEGEITAQKAKIEELQGNIRSLNDTIAQKDSDIAKLTETKLAHEHEIATLKKQIDDLMSSTDWRTRTLVPLIQPGMKGRVITVDPKWNFVIMELTDEFLKEVLGADLSKPVPPAELLIMRGDKPDQFVAKVRLSQVRVAEKFGVADVLVDWLQAPIKAGDLVRYGN